MLLNIVDGDVYGLNNIYGFHGSGGCLYCGTDFMACLARSESYG